MRRFIVCLSFCMGCSSNDFAVGTPVDDSSVESGDSITTDSGSDSCVDVTFCDDKCGLGLIDACGARRDCATDCGADKLCDGVTHKCQCSSVAKDTWCKNRCGSTKDNCGKDVDCGSCATGVTCTAGACGCAPDSDTVTCTKAAAKCGPATNNCDQTISCGSCPTSQSCIAGKCCDLKIVTCAGKCGTVVNGCGTSVDCGGCLAGQTCCKGACVNTNVDFANCGSCGATCATITHSNKCESGGCTCTGHEANTDLTHCGPCPGSVSMDCTKGGRTSCVSGVCR